MLCFGRVAELLLKCGGEVVPYSRDVVVDWVQALEPGCHVSDPLVHSWPFNQCEGQGNLSDGGLESGHVGVE